MLSRIATLAVAISCLCSCARESTQDIKAVDALKGVLPAVASSTADATPPPLPVAVPKLHLDTAIPAMSLDTTTWTDTRQVFDASPSAPSFQCAPSPFTPADTLTLRIAVPHGDWLKAKRPDETMFNIVSPGTPGEPNYSVIPSETFPDMLIIRFHGDIRSRPLVSGHETVETIFDQPGRYTFQVGNDAGGRGRGVRECTIRLVPLSRY